MTYVWVVLRILALDLGERRLGLAVSDAEGRIAFPAGALVRRDLRTDLAALGELIAERGVEAVVVGLPIHMSGRRGPEAAAAERFALRLREATGLPVSLLDERWTSRAAERALSETAGGRRARRRDRGTVDAVAATLLLQTYLDRRAFEPAGAAPSDSRA